MLADSYAQLALDWKPETKNNKQFMLITLIMVLCMLLLGIAMSLVNVPQQKRQARVDVPERIANFILDKVKPKPEPRIIIKPKIKPQSKPEIKKITKPKVKKIISKKTNEKVLTKTQKNARDKAAKSGLLALGNELADLMDTDDVSAMLGGPVKSTPISSTKAINNNRALLLADAGKGSNGVDVNEYSTTITTNRKLSQREIIQVKQALLAPQVQAKTQAKVPKSSPQLRHKTRRAGVRAEEGITIVFDQNKSKLFSIYNRARRKNPGLRGKIILEITVLPSGKVSKINVVSNELHDTNLVSRLLKRIKQFNFGAQHVEEITVTYPIEFLPA